MSEGKRKFVEEEIQYPLRQRTQDLQQQLAVNQQGVIAVEILIRNNGELIRGVNRAINVTVSALNVAVAVAVALTNQKIVLDKITALNATTSTMIEDTARRLKTQGVAIHKQSSGTMLDVESLKRAFVDITSALDDISRFRQEALPVMATQIAELDALTTKAEEVIVRMEEGNRTREALANGTSQN